MYVEVICINIFLYKLSLLYIYNSVIYFLAVFV